MERDGKGREGYILTCNRTTKRKENTHLDKILNKPSPTQHKTQARKQATRQTEQQHENRALASDRLSQYLLVVEVSSPLYNEAAAIST